MPRSEELPSNGSSSSRTLRETFPLERDTDGTGEREEDNGVSKPRSNGSLLAVAGFGFVLDETGGADARRSKSQGSGLDLPGLRAEVELTEAPLEGASAGELYRVNTSAGHATRARTASRWRDVGRLTASATQILQCYSDSMYSRSLHSLLPRQSWLRSLARVAQPCSVLLHCSASKKGTRRTTTKRHRLLPLSLFW